MLNVTRLRILTEVAYRGSLSAAAESLSYTQSAVSQQIAALEAETGMALLERHPRGVQPDGGGPDARGPRRGHPRASLEAADAALAAIAGLRGGRLRVASFPTAGATLMPLAIARFRTSYPDVELTLAEGEPEEIVPRLRAGELDLALLFEFPGQSRLRARRDARGAAVGPAAPRAPPRAPARARAVLDPPGGALRGSLGADVRLEPVRAATSCAAAWPRASSPRVAFESDDYQTVQGLVAAGVGVALIPELALSVVREDIVIRALAPAPPTRTVIALAPGGARVVPAAPPMLGMLEEAAGRLPGELLPLAG